MWPTGHPPRWLAAGNFGSVPAGPAITTLRSVIARIASVVRCFGIAYVGIQVAIWHSFYAASPWQLAGPAAAAVWAAVAVIYLRRRAPVWTFACIDSGFYVVLALTAEWCVPPATRGEAASWLVIVMASQLIVPAWYAPAVMSVPLTLASPAAYLVGANRTAGADGGNPPVAVVALLMVAAVHWYGRRKLYSHAAGADAALAVVDRDAREQYIILSRNMERREHERLVHDTVLNTLTALARAGDGDVAQAVGRCRHDVALIESALSDSADLGPADLGRADLGREELGWAELGWAELGEDSGGGPYGGLTGAVRAVAAAMMTRGLKVHVEIDDGVPAETSVPVPAAVAAAIAHAVREALSNVATHAGTGEAWVEVSQGMPGGNAAVPGRLQVIVRDKGAGFDPARVDRSRLGLRRSITERIADWGGESSILSAPGQGTVVSLSWPARGWPERAGLRQRCPVRGARHGEPGRGSAGADPGRPPAHGRRGRRAPAAHRADPGAGRTP
jgi:signal transduction histidine kinase